MGPRIDDDLSSLDAVEAALKDDPHTLDALAPAVCIALLERLDVLRAHLHARVFAALLPTTDTASASPERPLRVREAAAALAMSVDYVHRNWKKLGAYRDADNRIKFAPATIRRHLRNTAR